MTEKKLYKWMSKQILISFAVHGMDFDVPASKTVVALCLTAIIKQNKLIASQLKMLSHLLNKVVNEKVVTAGVWL